MPSPRATVTYRGVACVDDAVTDGGIAAPARGRDPRHSLQFRQAPGRRARPRRVSPAGRAHQAAGLARRAALRCRGHPDPAGSSAAASTCRSSSITWAESRPPRASSSGRSNRCSICSQTIHWHGSRSAAPNACRWASGRSATRCRSRSALIAVDSQRILWGTDWPHPNITKDMPNDGELVDLFRGDLPGPGRCGGAFWWTTQRACIGPTDRST